MNNKCNIPPDSWSCSREPGHSGPCAARKIDPELKITILNYFEDAVGADFFYYSRKECEKLPLGTIEKALMEGIVTKQDFIDVLSRIIDGNST